MTIIFTEEEQEYLNKAKFKWTIKKDCPPKIKRALEHKLKLLYKVKQGGR